MSTVPAKIEKLIEAFKADEALQAKFQVALDKLPLRDLIWPEKNPSAFPREFRVKNRSTTIPYPLWEPADRLDYVQRRIEAVSRSDSAEKIHPALAYYYLGLYEAQFEKSAEQWKAALARLTRGSGRGTQKKAAKKASKKASPKSAAKSAKKAPARPRLPLRVEEEAKLYARVRRLKTKLRVAPELKKAKSSDDLMEALLLEFQALSDRYADQGEKMRALESDVENYRNPDYAHPEIKKTMSDIVNETTALKVNLNRERRRNESLEREVHRLAEQIVSAPDASRDPFSEELETSRREYSLLSEKYDSLVSKNIELANRLDRIERAEKLEQILDIVRDKINGAIRAGVTRGDDVLLNNIKKEVDQIKRARTYLGRALYDIGMLYLRIGRKRDAIRELRAARELGIEDPEINKLINS